MEAFFTFISDKYPTIGLFIVFGVIVIWLTKLYTRFTSSEKTVNSLQCHKHNADISILRNQVDFMQDIKDSIRKIEEYIIKSDREAIDQLIRKCSPYKLTSIGEVVFEVSGGKDCVDNNVEFFIGEIEKMNPLTALDVENYALTVLNENLKSVIFNNVKDYVFAIPSPTTVTAKDGSTATMSLKIEDLLLIMSIFLRDKYFEKHTDINTSGFFKHE